MNEIKFKIGEFSRLSKVTVRAALRANWTSGPRNRGSVDRIPLLHRGAVPENPEHLYPEDPWLLS